MQLSSVQCEGLAGGIPCPIPCSSGPQFPLRLGNRSESASPTKAPGRRFPHPAGGQAPPGSGLRYQRGARTARSRTPPPAPGPGPAKGHCACSALPAARGRDRTLTRLRSCWAALLGGAGALGLLASVSEWRRRVGVLAGLSGRRGRTRGPGERPEGAERAQGRRRHHLACRPRLRARRRPGPCPWKPLSPGDSNLAPPPPPGSSRRPRTAST